MHQVLWAIGIIIVAYVAYTIYLAMVLRWEDRNTSGLAYYGRPPEARAAYRRRLRLHAMLLRPLLAVNSRMAKLDFRRAGLKFHDVTLPLGSCDAASAARADTYQPRPEDVFVATQMKCGTTWMEHIVYQVVHRGAGDLVETGRTLYGVAPWLEGRRSIPLEQSQPLGTARPTRIIKTHMPAHLCPSGGGAKFIYVARHPVSCFASCIDFIVTNAGRMAPQMPAYETWFTSPELMWWGTWTSHVRGWWDRSRRSPDVLYTTFEEMKKDLPGVIRQVAQFLGVPALTEAELAAATGKCSFAYMQKHQNAFEMQPPHVLQTNAALFVRGSADRHQDIPADVRQRIAAWAAGELAGSDFPLGRLYPDVTA